MIKTSKKQKKSYCLRPNDWNIAERASKNEHETAVEKLKELEGCTTEIVKITVRKQEFSFRNSFYL